MIALVEGCLVVINKAIVYIDGIHPESSVLGPGDYVNNGTPDLLRFDVSNISDLECEWQKVWHFRIVDNLFLVSSAQLSHK